MENAEIFFAILSVILTLYALSEREAKLGILYISLPMLLVSAVSYVLKFIERNL